MKKQTQVVLIEERLAHYQYSLDTDYYQACQVSGLPTRDWIYIRSAKPLTSDLVIVKPTEHAHIYEAVPDSEVSTTVSGTTPDVCPQQI
jgi:hypothetical protein